MTMQFPHDATALPTPGLRWGDYPELSEPPGTRQAAPRPTNGGASRRACARRLARVRRHGADWSGLDARGFGEQRCELQVDIATHGLTAELAERCAAFVVEAARRALGLAAYDGQVLAALQMLDNRLVEMATGEGKSLAVALAAAMAGLAGIPVHVLTANDYLVARDAQTFKPLYASLGLAVATVVTGDAPDARRSAYGHAIVYVTAKEVAFDYLRDRLMHGAGRPALQQRVSDLVTDGPPRRLLRGLCMAIIDEADSILIDEARTPLILSREVSGSAARAFLWQAWALSARLVVGVDFDQVGVDRHILLRDTGRARIAELAAALHPVWQNTRHREETIVAALTARHVLLRDRDYVVELEDGKTQRDAQIAIVDATSGRIAEGRRWSGGLHALVAIKEGCRTDPELETLARITFQRFFRRYHRLAGMSGTLREARRELAGIYGLTIVPIAPRVPNQRVDWPVRCFTTDAARWAAVVRRTQLLTDLGRPVLIGTDSVADSAAVSSALHRAGIAHALLNANHDAAEADIIAKAGATGRVTVSTHMAGRGTDISPDARALRAGGLHVIACQMNASRRLDRQLAGRAARQGQPGSAEVWISLESARFSGAGGGHALARIARAFARGNVVTLPPTLLHAALRALQAWDEARDARARKRLLREDCDSDRALSFTGRP